MNEVVERGGAQLECDIDCKIKALMKEKE